MSAQDATKLGRRSFLKKGFCMAGGIGLGPIILPSGLFGAEAPSNRITMGFIGTGDHGTGTNLRTFLNQPDAQVLAVCDVDREKRERAQQIVHDQYGTRDCAAYGDFRELLAREDIDAVMVSTPDHWHVLLSVLAVRAGKDVCCEKPTLTIAEGQALVRAVRGRGAVFQMSTEDRAVAVYHRIAELVRNGRIGRLERIRVKLPSGQSLEDEAPEEVPEGLDYDLWLGSAPWAPYTRSRCERMHWRQISDYSGGLLSDWGAHLLDTAQWGNDTERSGPVWVEGQGVFNPSSMFNTAIEYRLHYRYASGVELFIESGGVGIRFEGTEGWVGNEGWLAPLDASSEKILRSEIRPEETRLFTCPEGEQRNFLDCVKTRRDPYFPAEIGHRCSSVLHMGNIAMALGRPLRWDPVREEFENDDEANRLRSRAMRDPWRL